jgi:hypothetical protein
MVLLSWLGLRALTHSPVIQAVAAFVDKLLIAIFSTASRWLSKAFVGVAPHPPRRPRPKGKTALVMLIRITLVLLFALSAALVFSGAAVSMRERYVARDELWQTSGRTALSEGPVFQDFVVGGGGNVSPVTLWWADAFNGCLITGAVKSEQPSHGSALSYLHCSFRRSESGGGWPPSVVIRGQAESAVIAKPKYGTLVIPVRVPETVAEAKFLSFRVRDRFATYWKCISHKGAYAQFEIQPDGRWHDCRLSLSDPKRWEVFQPDGNAKFAAPQPDFTVVIDVAVEMGDRGGDRLAPGTGVLDIGPISFE